LEINQLNLFEDNNNLLAPRADKLVMSQDSLQQWKERVFQYQQQVRHNPPPQQASLFDLAAVHCESDSIDPFSLKLQPSQFYRMSEQGDAVCIYFVIDNALPILLYVGETKRTPKQRWITHDCQNYIAQYIELHRRYQLDVAVCTAFWWHTPADRKARQKLERELILKWRSPFNKENWELWGQPFKK
jgi:hypothetical protein